MKWGCVETRKIQSEELWVSDQWWMSGVGKAGDDLPNVIRTPPALQTFPTGGERRRGIGRPATHARFQCWAKRKSGNINWCSAQPVIAVEWRRRMDLFSRGEILDSPGGQSSIPFPDSALLATPHHCTALTCSTYLLDQGPKYANLTSFLKWERRISLWPQREKTGLVLALQNWSEAAQPGTSSFWIVQLHSYQDNNNNCNNNNNNNNNNCTVTLISRQRRVGKYFAS